MSAQPEPVWFTIPAAQTHTCTCWQPRPTRVRRPRKVYLLLNERPVFLKPSETADWTPEELCEYRKDWAKL